MKEIIAKIIQDGVCSGDSSWDEITLEILKAMREPTDKMVLGADLYSSAEDSIGIYQAMIDAVIND